MIMLFVNAPSLKALMCWTNVVEGQRVHWDVELKIKNKKTKNIVWNGREKFDITKQRLKLRTTHWLTFLNVDVLALRGN